MLSHYKRDAGLKKVDNIKLIKHMMTFVRILNQNNNLDMGDFAYLYELVKRFDIITQTNFIKDDTNFGGIKIEDDTNIENTVSLKDDPINPNHYKTKDGIQPIHIINAYDLNFDLGNVVKYTCRAGKKEGNSKSQDLNKALWYLQNEIEKGEK